MTSKTRISDGRYWSYTYDHRNQMTQAIEKTTSTGSVVQTIDYGYDVFGNVVREVVTTGSAVTTKYAYQNTDNSPGTTHSVHEAWADLDGSGNVSVRYMLGDLAAEKLARSGSGTSTAWLLTDRLGSVRELQDTTGAIVKSLTYDGFGNILTETGAADKGRFLFAGYGLDSASGLYMTHWRWYNPANGQWTSEDPIGFAGGDANVRRYVKNQVTDQGDWSGLVPAPVRTKPVPVTLKDIHRLRDLIQKKEPLEEFEIKERDELVRKIHRGGVKIELKGIVIVVAIEYYPGPNEKISNLDSLQYFLRRLYLGLLHAIPARDRDETVKSFVKAFEEYLEAKTRGEWDPDSWSGLKDELALAELIMQLLDLFESTNLQIDKMKPK